MCRRQLFSLQEDNIDYEDHYDEQHDEGYEEVDEDNVEDYLRTLTTRDTQDTDGETRRNAFEATRQEPLFSAEEINKLLEDTWSKTWSMLSSYRYHMWRSWQAPRITSRRLRHAFHAGNADELYSSLSEYERRMMDSLCPTADNIVHSFFDIATHISSRHGVVDVESLLSENMLEALERLLCDMREQQKGHIRFTGGFGEMPMYQFWRRAKWDAALAHILTMNWI